MPWLHLYETKMSKTPQGAEQRTKRAGRGRWISCTRPSGRIDTCRSGRTDTRASCPTGKDLRRATEHLWASHTTNAEPHDAPSPGRDPSQRELQRPAGARNTGWGRRGARDCGGSAVRDRDGAASWPASAAGDGCGCERASNWTIAEATSCGLNASEGVCAS
jgi:hypothetical protein